MRATLEFSLPEDGEEFDAARNANKLYCALLDVRDLLRKQVKYNGELTLEQIYEQVCSICSEVGV